MSAMEEIEAAIEGARSVSDLPIAVTLSFDTAGRTMMGVTGTMVAEQLRRMRVRGSLHDSTMRDLAGWTRSLGKKLAGPRRR